MKASDQHEPRFRQSSDCLIKATVLQKFKLEMNNVSNFLKVRELYYVKNINWIISSKEKYLVYILKY